MSIFTRMILLGVCLFGWTSGYAELLDVTKVNDGGNVNAPLGVINKSLDQQIGAGHGDVNTPGSAVYLIKRDPARSVRRGRQLFQRKFSMAEGVGPRVNFDSTGDVTVNRALGAGLADSCALCHGRPRGSAGFGGDVATRPDSRDAPALFGLGLPEQLADEMTAELRAIRTAALAQAANKVSCTIIGTNTWPGNYQVDVRVTNTSGATINSWEVTLQFNVTANIYNNWDSVVINGYTTRPIARNASYNGTISPGASMQFGIQGTRSGFGFTPPTCSASGVSGGTAQTRTLTAKGVNFGSITANPNGTVNTGGVVGVNPDLRVRPFFAQGGTVSMREFINGAFNDEMGLQSVDTVLCAVTDPVNPQRIVSPAGFVFDPALDVFERPRACGSSTDPDGDGVTNEIDTAVVDHMEFYFLNYFKPGQYRVSQRAQEGLTIMNTIGCTSCHVQNLTINRDRRVADLETVYDPVRGIFNDLFATAATLFHPVPDGNPFPQLLPNEASFTVRNFFSDLKRHDLGAFFHEREYNGTLVTQFVTEPLWGVATSAPYGHDGRSVNLNEVILRHGGEAQTARNNYAARAEDDRQKVQEFLQTLTLFPPDDTASSLNPGNPNTTNPQTPAEHGSIDLSKLFQIPAEGQE
ncbi:MAG TPA: cellulose binding domain-containing protein [Gammaproteobacteria bacterium]|nr:cellulose binding domain-containing protein [Gammaproteobacteria bacterium]